MILRAVKIRLYPNKRQEQTLNRVLGCYRFVYNQMLARKQESYNTDKKQPWALRTVQAFPWRIAKR